MSLPARIATIRGEYDHCFGCGTENPIGLNLAGFERVDDTVRASFTPRTDHHGFSDLLHGGIVAAALDEIMAWTAILVEEVMVMTGRLDLRYRKPAKVDSSFMVKGVIVERSGRRLTIESEMRDGDVIIAQGSGLFLAVKDLSEDSPES
ncbi:MAG: PaaI family thioesterase [bacterium]|nr:PaaI family thioesterase [bacterium]